MEEFPPGEQVYHAVPGGQGSGEGPPMSALGAGSPNPRAVPPPPLSRLYSRLEQGLVKPNRMPYAPTASPIIVA